MTAPARLLLLAAVALAPAPVAAAPPPDRIPVTVVAFGDSITAPRGPVVTYAALLQRDLPKHGVDAVVVNAGVPGNTTVSARARFQKDALDRNPDVVLILLGANDCMVDVWKTPPATEPRVPLATTEANLRFFVRAARAKGARPVLLTLIPFRWTDKLKGLYGKPPYDPADPMGLNATVVKYQAAVRTVATTERVPLVDLYPAFEAYGAAPGRSLDDLYLDGMHPSDKGHRLIADKLLPVVAGLFATPTAAPPAPAAEPDGVTRVRLLPPGPGNPRNSEGAFVTLKDGRILFVYTHFTGGSGDHATAHLAARSSADGGRTWTDRDEPVIGNEGKQNVMSVSLLRLADGRVALFYLRKNGPDDCRLFLRTSADEAKTWSAPVECTNRPGYYVVNNDRVVQLKSGRLVVPAARHNLDPAKGGRWSDALCFLSDDGGKSWRPSATVLTRPPESRSGLQEPGVVELKDGRLMMLCRTDLGCQYRSHSADGGHTWEDAKPSDIKSPLSPASVKRIPTTGDLLLVWNDHAAVDPKLKDKRTPFTVAVSKDDGKTWCPSIVLEADPDGWYCYTAIHFAGDRVLLGHCAGDAVVGRLNRTNVTSFPVSRLYR